EDGSITLSQEQLLAQASDVEGDTLTALNLQTANPELTITDNGDGTFTLTPAANFNGDLDISFDVFDGEATVAANIDLTVNPVNDAPTAIDDYMIAAGPGAIRLDSELDLGKMQYQTADGNWHDMIVGVEYSADTELQYVPNDGATDNSMDVFIGTFDPEDSTAEPEDWGSINNGVATFIQGDLTVVTSMSNGNVTAYNSQDTHIGLGIGDPRHNGLSDKDVMSVEISGDEINHVTFELSGLGSWFDANNNQATQVVIRAYDTHGNLIDSQGGFRESGNLEDSYSFTTDQPVAKFELGTVGGRGQYVVKNMTISRVSTEEIKVTSIQPDGSAITNTHSLNLTENMDDSVNLTDELVEISPNITEVLITVGEDSVLTLTPENLLNNDFDIDGDALSLVSVAPSENTHGTVEINDAGNVVYTPNGDYNGQANFTYTIVDEEGLTDTATVYFNVIPENDSPAAEAKFFDVNEDSTITITDADLLAGATDVDGDTLTISDVSYSGTDGVFIDNGDDTYTFAPNSNFSGNVELSYKVSDGVVETQAQININVIEINDPPIAGATSYTMDEDSVITITSDQLLANSYDIEIGVRLEEVTYTGSDGIFQAHQDSEGQPYFTFAPNQNFNGEIVLGVTISDGELTDTTTASIDVLPINDPPVVGDLAYAINEDESITLSQEQLLVQASDIEGDDLVAVNLQSIDGNVSITANTDGSFTLTPNSDLNGAFDISFGVFDGEATVAANIDLTVNPVNDLPVAQDQNFQMNEDGTITLTDGDLLTGASDVDGDTLSISDVAYTGTDGIFTDNG
ncbi:cadherin-like domain-containing protein, partial [Oleiphilus sp. HI0125]|uniref:cadherin-like domain-containing protein n=2 Tax=Oleiphilus sp. HI0125 TaxID=1822266 RepID=UPI000AC6BFA4